MKNDKLVGLAASAKKASYELLSENRKNAFLHTLARIIRSESQIVLRANKEDIIRAEHTGLSAPMLERLKLTEEGVDAIATGVDVVRQLPDPVGKVLENTVSPDGLHINKVSVPIGVIGIVYESRPNVTIDCAALCFKSGNACILRGGKEASNTNSAFASLIERALLEEGINTSMIQVLPSSDRELLKQMLHLDAFIDCIIPRGGEALIRFVSKESTIPVIKHYKGVCSVYIDASAKAEMAQDIVLNGKCQRPGVCNSIENLFVDKGFDEAALISILKALVEAGVELRVDSSIHSVLNKAGVASTMATEEDYYEEFLALTLSVKHVSGVDEAIEAIHKYGSKHSEAIVAENATVAEDFLNRVDASTVYWNASTRFTDGSAFGLGAEIGISTDKLHARGPMGLKELCTYKYKIIGKGQVRK